MNIFHTSKVILKLIFSKQFKYWILQKTKDFRNIFSKNKLDKDKAIIFILPNHEFPTGGILSIFNILDVTTKMYPSALVEAATYGRKIQYVYRHTWFDNKFDIRWTKSRIKKWSRYKQVIIHVPDSWADRFCDYIHNNGLENYVKNVTLNILNQNMNCMNEHQNLGPGADAFKQITMTLAFKCNEDISYSFLKNKPVYISAWMYGDTVDTIPYEKKEDLCIISPDGSPYKDEVIQKLEAAGINCFRFTKIPYPEFRALQRRAKWTISFGEGYDGYSCGEFRNDGIGFGVYDPLFFPKDIDPENLPPYFFKSHKEMSEKILSVIQYYQDKDLFIKDSKERKDKILALNSPTIVENGLREYYSSIFKN